MVRVFILFKNNIIKVTPNIVNLKIGEHLNWDILIQQQHRNVTEFKIQIYFLDGSPFNLERPNVFETRQPAFTESSISAGSANSLAYFKYGVRIVDASTNEIIEDEDPYINVLR